MRSSSSPSYRPAYHGYDIAFQAVTGELWTYSNGVGRSTGLPMKHGTSPRGTAAVGDEIAFQGYDGTLWTYRNGAGHSTGLAMRPATSPDVMPDAAGGFWIAYQADTSELRVVSPTGQVTSTGRRMRSGASPILATNTSGEPYVAFQADTGQLWLVDVTGAGASTGQAMFPGTNPALIRNDFLYWQGFTIAWEAPNGEYWAGFVGINGPTFPFPSHRFMRPGTSPSIALSTDFAVAYQSTAGELWITDTHGVGTATGLRVMALTSPAIAGPVLI
jgi:hypothetical protein